MNFDSGRVPAELERRGTRARNIIRALGYRDFRLLWIGLTISAIGTWMQIVALGLLVLKITHGSAFALGTLSFVQALSFFFFALVGGSVADRIDKRRLLLFTQSISAGLAILLGLLTWTGVIQFWMLLLISFLNGTVLSFDQPARGALLAGLIPKRDLMNAISLQSTLFNGAAAVGPVLAGFGINLLGFAGSFLLNGASFIGVLIALCVISSPAQSGHGQTTLTAISSSLHVFRQDAVLPWVLAGYGALVCFGPSPALILPVYATEVLHVGPERLGLLFSSFGSGCILGALVVASFGKDARKGYIFFIGILIWVIALTSFALSGRLWQSVVALLLVGVGQTFAGTSTITLLQTRVHEQMRGRVMSVNTLLVMGIRPLGDFPAGALMSAIGPSATLLLAAALVGTYAVVAAFKRPSLRLV